MRRQKLKPDQIEEIRLALDSGAYDEEIAARLQGRRRYGPEVRIRLRRQAAA